MKYRVASSRVVGCEVGDTVDGDQFDNPEALARAGHLVPVPKPRPKPRTTKPKGDD